jgi:hypothetical protein
MKQSKSSRNISFHLMKKIYALLTALVFATASFAQQSSNWCGTGQPTQANYEFLENLHAMGIHEARVTNEVIHIPMKIHIIRNSAGVGNFNFSDALRNMCELNDWYRPHGIQFFLRGDVNYIDNTQWSSNFQRGDENTINPIHNVANVINVYYVNMTAVGLCGFANFPGTGSPSQTTRQGAVYLSPGCSGVGNTTFAHELGHHLNLMHPFQTTSDNPAGIQGERITRNTSEVAPRLSANCTTAGDRFCDTPADYIGDRWSCPRSHTQLDINGDVFNPDATLIMGYANDNCVTRFSPQQVTAMRATLTIVNGVSGPRRYWLNPPMDPYDTITSTPTMLEPAVGQTGVAQNFAFFKWRKVPGATMYLLRLRFNFNTLEEILVSDTSYLYTGTKLNANVNYRWSVAAINHKITCINWTPDRTFTTVANGVSVAELENLKFQVYPTVVGNGDRIKIEFQESLSGDVEVAIQDMSGRTINREMVSLTAGGIHETSINSQSAGIYFIKVSQNGFSQFERIVVTK